MSASLLEKLLIFIIILIIAATFGIYYFLSNFAKTQSDKANQSQAKADSSQKDIDNITASYKWLNQNPEVVSKTNKIVAEATYYQYQDQVIGDLESYANQAGVRIQSYNFSDTAATPGATTGAAAPSSGTAAASKPAAGATTPQTGSSSSTSNLKTATVQISFGKSVSPDKFIIFLKKIEQNVTRMQVTDLNLTPNTQTPGTIDVEMSVSVFLNK